MYPILLALVATLESDQHFIPIPFTLATALQSLQLSQGRASNTPTFCRTRHCNIRVERTRPNAVDRLGWTIYEPLYRLNWPYFTRDIWPTHFIREGEQKCPIYVTPKSKIIWTPSWHAGWYSPKSIFRKMGFELMTLLLWCYGHIFFEKWRLFSMTSEADQIFCIVSFLILNHETPKSS